MHLKPGLEERGVEGGAAEDLALSGSESTGRYETDRRENTSAQDSDPEVLPRGVRAAQAP